MSSNNSINRYSMPVTRSRTGLYDVGLDQTNTTRFLFGDEDSNALAHSVPDENFPTLVRRDDQMVSSVFHLLCNFHPKQSSRRHSRKAGTAGTGGRLPFRISYSFSKCETHN